MVGINFFASFSSFDATKPASTIGKNVLEYVAAATGILRKEIPPSAATAVTRFGYKNAAPITAVTYGLQSNTFPQVNPTMIGMKYMIASPAAYRTR